MRGQRPPDSPAGVKDPPPPPHPRALIHPNRDSRTPQRRREGEQEVVAKEMRKPGTSKEGSLTQNQRPRQVSAPTQLWGAGVLAAPSALPSLLAALEYSKGNGAEGPEHLAMNLLVLDRYLLPP